MIGTLAKYAGIILALVRVAHAARVVLAASPGDLEALAGLRRAMATLEEAGQ